MAIKVYKYGALPPAKDGAIRTQMALAREYYNLLVEAENARRAKTWGQDTCPVPADHEHPKSGKCTVCDAHYTPIRDAYRAAALLDMKPVRAVIIEKGLHWTTYLMVEEAFSAAWKKTKSTDRVRFRSWKRGGIMGARLMRDTAPESRYTVTPIADGRTGRRAGQRMSLRVRTGTGAGNVPIWSDPINIEMHRPVEGRVVEVKICMSYVGDRETWSVNVTCADAPEAERAAGGYVAIDIGWRCMPDGSLRIAYAHGSDDKDRELLMSQRWRELADRADRIQAERGRMLNDLQAVDKHFARAKHSSSVAYVIKRDGISPDKLLIDWVKRERHLAQYEIGCRRRSVAARRDSLRVWLSKLRKQYKTAIIKDSSHKEMKDHKKAVESGMPPKARRNGQHAAPGEVVDEICKTFGRSENVAIVEAPYTTATCIGCGNVIEINGGQTVHCERCCGEFDRDYVSTRNMEKLYTIGDVKKPTARKTTAKFAKRHKISDKISKCQLNGL